MIFGNITIELEQLDIIKQAIEPASLDTTLENLLLWNGAVRFISQKNNTFISNIQKQLLDSDCFCIAF